MKKALGEEHASIGDTGLSHTLSLEGSGIRITEELPGAGEEMIHIDLDEKVLTISVDGKGQRYGKAIVLPCEARLARKRFHNGVLELYLEKAV
jgi:HSP20 family molecular chaperone IbpA